MKWTFPYLVVGVRAKRVSTSRLIMELYLSVRNCTLLWCKLIWNPCILLYCLYIHCCRVSHFFLLVSTQHSNSVNRPINNKNSKLLEQLISSICTYMRSLQLTFQYEYLRIFLRIFECKRNNGKNCEKAILHILKNSVVFAIRRILLHWLNANFKIERTCSAIGKEEIHAKYWLESTRNEAKESKPAFFQNSLKAI